MRIIIAAIAVTLAMATSAFAQTPIGGYCAQISDNDKYASDGYHLTDAGSIIRQDRANWHRFGERDADDYPDNVFGSTAAREKIPAMLDAGNIEQGLAREIVRGYPYICVDIYPRFLSVYRGD